MTHGIIFSRSVNERDTYLYVSVCNLMLMQILDSMAQLVEEEFNSRLWEEATGHKAVKQLSTSRCLHHNKHFLWGFYSIQKLDDARLQIESLHQELENGILKGKMQLLKYDSFCEEKMVVNAIHASCRTSFL